MSILQKSGLITTAYYSAFLAGWFCYREGTAEICMMMMMYQIIFKWPFVFGLASLYPLPPPPPLSLSLHAHTRTERERGRERERERERER